LKELRAREHRSWAQRRHRFPGRDGIGGTRAAEGLKPAGAWAVSPLAVSLLCFAGLELVRQVALRCCWPVLLCVKPAIAGAGRLGFVVGLIADLLSALLLAAADALGWLL
jgi:hypothetical protein